MGFTKNKTIKGHINNYWRFLEIHSNMNRADAVCVFGLHKDKATRDANPNAVIETVQFNLGLDLLNATANNDTVKNINISKAYTALKNKATEEAAKPAEEQDGDLAFFSDAVEV